MTVCKLINTYRGLIYYPYINSPQLRSSPNVFEEEDDKHIASDGCSGREISHGHISNGTGSAPSIVQVRQRQPPPSCSIIQFTRVLSHQWKRLEWLTFRQRCWMPGTLADNVEASCDKNNPVPWCGGGTVLHIYQSLSSRRLKICELAGVKFILQ